MDKKETLIDKVREEFKGLSDTELEELASKATLQCGQKFLDELEAQYNETPEAERDLSLLDQKILIMVCMLRMQHHYIRALTDALIDSLGLNIDRRELKLGLLISMIQEVSQNQEKDNER